MGIDGIAGVIRVMMENSIQNIHFSIHKDR